MIVARISAAATWPLRWLGLDLGRAQANARPNARRSRGRRLEQFAYIAGRCAHDDDRLALISRGDGSAKDDVSIVVFDGTSLTRHHATMDSSLRESIVACPGAAPARR
jgi:hypothetical protein